MPEKICLLTIYKLINGVIVIDLSSIIKLSLLILLEDTLKD